MPFILEREENIIIETKNKNSYQWSLNLKLEKWTETPCGIDLGLKDNDIDVGYDFDDECDDDKHLINVYLLALY